MPAGIQVYSTTGELIFDSNNHRLIRFDTVVIPNWTVVSGTSNSVWRADVAGISPLDTYVTVSGVIDCFIYEGGVQGITWGSAPPSSSRITIYRF